MDMNSNSLFLEAINTVHVNMKINLVTDIYESLDRKQRFFIQSLMDQKK